MEHIGEAVLCDLDGKGFNLAGPHGRDPIPNRRQGEAANPIEEAPHRRRRLARGPRHDARHFGATACTTVRVVLTADCTV